LRREWLFRHMHVPMEVRAQAGRRTARASAPEAMLDQHEPMVPSYRPGRSPPVAEPSGGARQQQALVRRPPLPLSLPGLSR
jgi:hypothetical protein